MQNLIREFWPLLLPTLLGFAAIYLLLPRVRQSKWIWGALVGGIGLAIFVYRLSAMNGIWQEQTLFLIFSAVALIGAVMLITQKNPAHAALSFTLVIIATCGVFLLNGAPFLMAAMLIIYAGAILVTFLFVIMLAQQAGLGDADARSREPFLSCLAGFILLGALLAVIQRTYDQRDLQPHLEQVRRLLHARDLEEANAILGAEDGLSVKLVDDLAPYFSGDENTKIVKLEEYMAEENLEGMKAVAVYILERSMEKGSLYQPLIPVSKDESRPLVQSPFSGATSEQRPRVDPNTGWPRERLPAANVDAIGRSLFTDYLVPVLGAGVLLLVATIGAIAIAGRGAEDLR